MRVVFISVEYICNSHFYYGLKLKANKNTIN